MFKQLKYLKPLEWLLVGVIVLLLVAQVYCNLALPECLSDILKMVQSVIVTKDLKPILMKSLEMMGYVGAILVCTIVVSYTLFL